MSLIRLFVMAAAFAVSGKGSLRNDDIFEYVLDVHAEIFVERNGNLIIMAP